MSNSNENKAKTFKITNTKLYIPIVTLSSEDNVKLTNILSNRIKRFGLVQDGNKNKGNK